jgi:hypothetical protein
MNAESGRIGGKTRLDFSAIRLKGMENKKIGAKKCACFLIYD